jgi:HlyD family secretion protein
MDVDLEVPALGRRVPMKVFFIAAMGDFATWRATSAKDSFDLKTFEVRARPAQPVEGLRPGMTVRWVVPAT